MSAPSHLLLLALCLSAGCSTVARGADDDPVELRLGVACETAALATAAAARATLPCSDPLPWHGGAPLHADADGSFTVRYECDGTATVPVGDHRILGAADGAVRLLPTAGLPGNGGRARIALELRPSRGGATLRGHLDAALATRFRAELARRLAAPRMATAVAPVGDPVDARIHGQHAALAASDPTARAAVLAAVAVAPSTSPRQAAWLCLSRGDLAAARVLLHSARRDGPRPGADYELAAALHAEDADPMGAFAFRLLAREHERDEATPLVAAPPR